MPSSRTVPTTLPAYNSKTSMPELLSQDEAPGGGVFSELLDDHLPDA
jgi:hypothetical protein